MAKRKTRRKRRSQRTITITEAGARRGVTRQAAQKAIKDGKLLLEADGRIDPEHPTNAAWIGRPERGNGRLQAFKHEMRQQDKAERELYDSMKALVSTVKPVIPFGLPYTNEEGDSMENLKLELPIIMKDSPVHLLTFCMLRDVIMRVQERGMVFTPEALQSVGEVVSEYITEDPGQACALLWGYDKDAADEYMQREAEVVMDSDQSD